MRIDPTTRGLMAAFFRQKYKFLLTVIPVIAIGLALLAYTTPLYMSAGSILVRFGDEARPSISLSESGSHEGGGISEDARQEMIQSYISILKSHDLLLQVVQQFGGAALYPALAKGDVTPAQADEAAVGRLMAKDLDVKPGVSGDVIDINVLNPDPHMAQQLARRLIQVFVDRESDVYNKPQTAFLSEQMQHASDELARQQQQLKEFKERSGMTSIDDEVTQLMQQKSDVQSSAMDSIKESQTNVDQLKAKEADLLTTYRSDSFAVKSLHRTLVVAEEQLRAKQADLRAATMASNHGAVADGASSAAVGHIRDIDSRIKELEAQRTQYNDLALQVQISEKNYKTFKDQLEQARLSDTLNKEKITRVAILDEPDLEPKPARPKRSLVELLTGLAALMLGISVAVLSETLDQSFTTPWQVSHLLQVPVIASFTVSRKRTSHGHHA